MSESKLIRLELIKISEKILFEKYITSQLKLDLMLKTYPHALGLYLENCPSPPTEQEIIEFAKSLEVYIDGNPNE